VATTISKRTPGTPSGGETKRVSGAISDGVTKRLTTNASQSIVARVNRDQYQNSIYDPWGGSWGASWGAGVWLVLIKAIGLGHMIRTEEPAFPALLLLEADNFVHGPHITLENGTDKIEFEDIESSTPGIHAVVHVKRVAEPVI